MALPAAQKTSMLLGVCVPSLKTGASKFKVKRLELDTNLNMYFAKHEYVYAHDPSKLCKTGDVVLIEQLAKKLTKLITHEVKEVVYPLGDLTCPLTGKKIIAGKFRDDIEAINKVYGERSGRFDYDKAPPRGWQEDKKDFTHVETYIKYHDDGTEQPYAV
ncbi:28S ribosomal protein S17, mitochondrial [Anthonomus grandis grandis]|uniref:28S ribosomal protein S17, mitochondrial n=1 Tax=Anthonomus grandis grandis TaxID=2921223 RepID=UPI002166A1C9|nr:28S ribosomal protein S17, mitochondrial [Anthonomus grandis grandis]